MCVMTALASGSLSKRSQHLKEIEELLKKSKKMCLDERGEEVVETRNWE